MKKIDSRESLLLLSSVFPGGNLTCVSPEASLLRLRRKFQALPLGAKRQCEIANVDPPQTFLDQFLVDQNIAKTKFTQNLPCIKWVKKVYEGGRSFTF